MNAARKFVENTNVDKRKAVRVILKDFEFETENDELDFAINNGALVKHLPLLASHLKRKLGDHVKLRLELLNEGPEWQTLFICPDLDLEWEESRRIVDEFWGYVYTEYPQVAEKINIHIESHVVDCQ